MSHSADAFVNPSELCLQMLHNRCCDILYCCVLMSQSLYMFILTETLVSFQILELLPWGWHICFIPDLWIITVVVPHLLHSDSLNYYRGGVTYASFQIFDLLPWWCHTCFFPNLWFITVVVPHLLRSKSSSVCHSLIILPLWHAERKLCFYLKLIWDAEDSHSKCVFRWQIIPSILLCSLTSNQLLCMNCVKYILNYKWSILSDFPCTFRYFTFS